MYYNGKKGKSTVSFLKEVHTRVYEKYVIKQQGDIEAAKELQTFFQNLKKAAKDINSLPSECDKALYSELLQNITKN
jgi:hypothetical protein